MGDRNLINTHVEPVKFPLKEIINKYSIPHNTMIEEGYDPMNNADFINFISYVVCLQSKSIETEQTSSSRIINYHCGIPKTWISHLLQRIIPVTWKRWRKFIKVYSLPNEVVIEKITTIENYNVCPHISVTDREIHVGFLKLQTTGEEETSENG